MKIALFVPSWPPDSLPNGIVSYASQLVPALRRLGHEVFVLTPAKATGDSDHYTIALRDFAAAPTLWNRAFRKLAPDLAAFRSTSLAIVSAILEMRNRHGIDIFQIEDSYGWSLPVSRLRLLPVVVRLHGPWFLNGQFDNDPATSRSMQERIRREGVAIAAATAITAPSKNVLDATAKYYELDLRLTKVIPNATAPVEQDALWNVVSADRNSLLFVGRFDRHKGADVMLKAFARLATWFPELRLSFVGPDSGLTTSSGAVQTLHEYINCIEFDDVRSRVDYLGPLSREAIQELRPKSFVTVVASRYETFGNVVVEAMASGCPLVATAVGGILETVENGRNGLLVASEDSEAMASACRKLLEDPGMAARLGQQALQDCQDRHNPQKRAQETVAVYQDAVRLFRTS